MRKLKSIARKFRFGMIVALCSYALVGCEYEVPITPTPTRKVDERLLANWASRNGKDMMKVRRLDDFIYIVSYNGYLFRAYHSDIDQASFVSVQDIDSAERKYCYRTWRLTDDGQTLVLHTVNNKVIPKETKDPAVVRKLLRENLNNPELLKDETHFTKRT
jgi:hypothetical protein